MPSRNPENSAPLDLIVIGSGPAGQRAALQAAKAGKRVLIVEEHGAVGGACVHAGTLPSKSFRESVYRWSLSSHGLLGKRSERSGSSTRARALPDMKRLLERRNRVVSNEARIVSDQLRRNGVTLLQGRARVEGPHAVQVRSARGAAKRLEAKFLFVAVGASPMTSAKAPREMRVDGKLIHDSNTILTLKRLPKSLVVLGAGVIGCEYASMFSMAGSRVHLVDRRNEILASVDREIVAHLTERFESLGMRLVLEAETRDLKRGKNGIRLSLQGGRRLDAECLLLAQGRMGNTKDLGLGELGVELDERGLVKVDANFRTAVPSIYAVGDVIGAPALASTSMEQGRIACCHAFGLTEWGGWVMPEFYPCGIYTIPEISTVGASEEALKAEKVDFVAGKAHYNELARGQIVGDRWGLLKLMVERRTLRLLGVHIIGDNAADLVHIGQAVMDFGGGVDYFIRTVFNYPTLAEAYKTAAFHAVNQIRGTTSTK